MLFLANVTTMAREDKRLDSVRSECCGLIKNMALKEISENEYFQNLDSDSLQLLITKYCNKTKLRAIKIKQKLKNFHSNKFFNCIKQNLKHNQLSPQTNQIEKKNWGFLLI